MGTTVFRVEKNREFVVMNHRFLREREMSLKAKGLLALCLALPESWEYSLNGLVAICKESQTSIRSALKELETFHYLRRERKKDDKGQFVYEYILYEVPYDGFVHTDNQYTQKQDTGNANAENVIQESTNQESTNKLSIEEVSKEKNKDKEAMDDILMSLGNTELIELYWEYIDVRKDLNAPLNSRSLKLLVARNERLSKGNIKIQKLLLENAILNNWKNIYLPTESELQNTNKDMADDLRSFFGLE